MGRSILDFLQDFKVRKPENGLFCFVVVNVFYICLAILTAKIKTINKTISALLKWKCGLSYFSISSGGLLRSCFRGRLQYELDAHFAACRNAES